MRTTALFFEHFLVTLIGSSGGLLIGGVAGYALARILSNLYYSSVRLLKLGVLFPWRTALSGLLIPFAVPVVAVITFGLGAKTGIVSVGIAVAGLAAVFTSGILIRQRFPRSQRVELIAAARTVATLAAAILVAFGVFGAGGLGFLAMQHIRLLDYEEAIKSYILILIAILIFDLGIGVIHYFVTSREMSMATNQYSPDAAA